MISRTPVFVDVDDTLVTQVEKTPIQPTIDLVRALYEKGAVLYCWSTGGAGYAEQTARRLKIADCFTAFLPKPLLAIDDRGWAELAPIVIHPSKAGGMTADQFLDSLNP